MRIGGVERQLRRGNGNLQQDVTAFRMPRRSGSQARSDVSLLATSGWMNFSLMQELHALIDRPHASQRELQCLMWYL